MLAIIENYREISNELIRQWQADMTYSMNILKDQYFHAIEPERGHMEINSVAEPIDLMAILKMTLAEGQACLLQYIKLHRAVPTK